MIILSNTTIKACIQYNKIIWVPRANFRKWHEGSSFDPAKFYLKIIFFGVLQQVK